MLDNFATGRPSNLTQHQGRANFQLIEADVADGRVIARWFEGVNWVFHIAALADIVPSIQRPADYFRTNVDGTFAVLEAARTAGVQRFIYAGSSSCYGIPDKYPTEEGAEIRLEYPYALTKYLGEQLALHWANVYGMPVLSLRFFNVYGPRSRTSGTYGAVFGVFLAQKLAGKPFTVVGDGTQTRDFTYVTDVADACIMAAASNLSGEVMNVGSGKSRGVNELVNLIGGDVVYIPKRPSEPDCTLADTSKIRRLLGWEPKVALEEGVRYLLDDIEYWREAPVWTPDKIAEATADWFKYLSAR